MGVTTGSFLSSFTAVSSAACAGESSVLSGWIFLKPAVNPASASACSAATSSGVFTSDSVVSSPVAVVSVMMGPRKKKYRLGGGHYTDTEGTPLQGCHLPRSMSPVTQG